MIYDVIAIGGGLAGLCLAIDLRKRGYTVLVIEKGNYPRQKVCGEYISMESSAYLNSLCPELKTLRLPQIRKFALSSTGKREFYTPLELGGFGISRYLLDNLLFLEAKRVGVSFALNEMALSVKQEPLLELYHVTTRSNDFTGRLVCNSSGRKSNFETKEKYSKKKVTNYVGIKYHVLTRRDATQIEIHNFPGGYCGISNVEDGKSCLCYIVNSKMLNKSGNSIDELEKKYLYQNRNLKRIFTHSQFVTKSPVVISGINFSIKEPIFNDVFFLGDSAGTIAPITGNGMSISLRSAFKLTGYIDEFFNGRITKKQLMDNYKVFWMNEFNSRIALSRYFQKLSEYPFLTNLIIRLFNSFSALAKGVIKQTHGEPF